MVILIAIFIWGFSEATLFFIIPDVLLTLYAVMTRSFGKVVIACLICVLGAMIGGTLMYILAFNETDILSVVLSLPAIHPEMITHVHTQLSDNMLLGLMTGPLFGVPYKLFAVVAPEYASLVLFLMITIPARLSRFIVLSALAYALSHHLLKRMPIQLKLFIWAVVWVIGYSIYFAIIGV